MVAAFSSGLALTMIAAGAIAAWGLAHAQRKWAGLGDLFRKAPYVSSGLLVLLSIFMGWSALRGLL